MFTAIRNVINSPNFLMTSRRPIGWAPERSSALGTVETEAMCRSNLSSSTESEVERLRERERVYRASRDARDGEEGKDESSGGRPRRMRLPRTCVLLRDVKAERISGNVTHAVGSTTKSTSSTS